MFGKIKNKNIMENNEQFPRFILDKPRKLEMTFLKENLRVILQIVYVSTFFQMILMHLLKSGRCLG